MATPKSDVQACRNCAHLEKREDRHWGFVGRCSKGYWEGLGKQWYAWGSIAMNRPPMRHFAPGCPDYTERSEH
jgi:hypothetical protein